MKLPRSEVDQPSWALLPPLGTPHREKASFCLQPEPPMFQLVPLPLVISPCTSVKSLAVSSFHPVTSHQRRRSCWVLPKVSLLLADSAVVPQLSLQNKGFSPTFLVASPESTPDCRCLYAFHISSTHSIGLPNSSGFLEWNMILFKPNCLLGQEESSNSFLSPLNITVVKCPTQITCYPKWTIATSAKIYSDLTLGGSSCSAWYYLK